MSARAQNAALNASSPVSRGSPALGAGPQALRPGCPALSAARIAKVSAGNVAENPGLEVPKSGTETHTHTDTRARTHTHALPEVDKNQPTNTKCRRRRRSAPTSCCREDRMPTPGHCHFHSAPGTWAPRARLPPDSSLARGMSPPASRVASSSPSKCVNTKTIRVKPDRGELGPAGSPRVRETGVRTCPPRAERLGASSPRSLGRLRTAGPCPPVLRYSPATLVPDLRDGAGDNAGTPGSWGCGRRGVRGAAELRARRRRRCSARQLSGPLAVCQWELSGRLGRRPRGRSHRSPWETELRLGRLTIAPPPGAQSEAADTGAGRSELGWRVTTGARWVPALHPGPWRPAGRMRAPRAPALPPRKAPAARPGKSRGKQPRRGGLGNGEGAPNKAASGGPSGVRLLRL